MRAISFGLITIGLLLTIYAFAFETEVTTQTGLVGGVLVAGGSSYNVGLMQQQVMLLQTGLASALAGIILFACSVLNAKAEPDASDASGADDPAANSNEVATAQSETSTALPRRQSRSSSRRRKRSKRK